LPKKPKLAVMDIQDKTKKFKVGDLKASTEYPRSKLVASGVLVIIDQERQQSVLKMKKKSYKEFYSKSCKIQLGQALSADRILASKITYLMGQYAFTAEIIDLSKEATIGGASVDFKRINELVSVLTKVSKTLLGKSNNSSGTIVNN